MTWAKVDDTLWANRKVRKAGPEAMGLWLAALSYCAQHRSDGLVSHEDLEHLANVAGIRRAARLATALVSVGLWEETDVGWRFHDWQDYQPTRQYLDSLSERGKRGADARWHGRGHASANGQSGAAATATADARTNASANALPSRPPNPAEGARARVVPEPEPDPDPDKPVALPSHAAKLRELVEAIDASKVGT